MGEHGPARRTAQEDLGRCEIKKNQASAAERARHMGGFCTYMGADEKTTATAGRVLAADLHHDCGRSCCGGFWMAMLAGHMGWAGAQVSVGRASGACVTWRWLGVCRAGLAWRGAFRAAARERALRLCWRRRAAGVAGRCVAGRSAGRGGRQQERAGAWGEGWGRGGAGRGCRIRVCS